MDFPELSDSVLKIPEQQLQAVDDSEYFVSKVTLHAAGGNFNLKIFLTAIREYSKCNNI